MKAQGRALLIASMMVAAGCAPAVTIRTVTAPDGQPASAIECRHDESRCIDEAKRACPGGYYVLAVSAREGADVMSNGVAAPTYRGRMMIRCQ